MATVSFKPGLFIIFFIVASGFILDAEARTRKVDWCQKPIQCVGACASYCSTCNCLDNKCVCGIEPSSHDSATPGSNPRSELHY
ncbi:hypothetical protein NC653_036054 [Populus alba x Populus x berolinensis]|uniref:Uncharacterized protein n=1 Tax=Populus alba x Populus x berolinensis TaxID=444605 RepID=A0AAD6LJ64_9ROSI|nr:hypothetical protein NC653_036054 [Populus alba x Populus x berolinensis]